MNKPTCTIPGCKMIQHARRMCSTHYVSDWRNRNGLSSREPSVREAQACGHCGKPVMARQGKMPLHRACKDSVPLWKREGRESPEERATRKAESDSERKLIPARPRLDMRSDIRAGYEDGDYPRFLNGLRVKVVVGHAGCWEWQGQLKRGYPITKFKDKYIQVHRIVIEAREGKSLGVLAAHHKCGNSTCVNPDHLQPITHRENIAEMLARTSLEARIAELEEALHAISPNNEALRRISHLAAA